MLTGNRAFQGKSQASLIGAILKVDPPAIAATHPLTPPLVDHIVKRCLAKDPDERWQSASDLMRELRWVQQNPTEGGAAATGVVRDRTRERVLWAAAIVPAVVSKH